MSKDNVNISLDYYNRLVKSKEIAEYEAKQDIEDKVNEKVDELMKHTILIKKSSSRFRMGIDKTEIITNDDALKMSIEKSKEDYQERSNRMRELQKKYDDAIDQVINLKWYHLLFGTKK